MVTSLDIFIDTVWDKECPVHFKKFMTAYMYWCKDESQVMVRQFKSKLTFPMINDLYLEKRGYELRTDSLTIYKKI